MRLIQSNTAKTLTTNPSQTSQVTTPVHFWGPQLNDDPATTQRGPPRHAPGTEASTDAAATPVVEGGEGTTDAVVVRGDKHRFDFFEFDFC